MATTACGGGQRRLNAYNPRMLNIVLGTHNAKKLAELEELLPRDAVRLTSLADLPDAIEVEETGATFQENAALKATVQARQLGRWVLAEDSGISVDALDGRPGVFSARYAGDSADDDANNQRLLSELQGVPASRRGAHYNCQLCLADPAGQVRLEATGYCHGRIAERPAGRNGFGYDPLFVIPEYHRTFGQLDPLVKRILSHRGRGLRMMIPPLLKLARSASGVAGQP